jgi:hypothetical protein
MCPVHFKARILLSSQTSKIDLQQVRKCTYIIKILKYSPELDLSPLRMVPVMSELSGVNNRFVEGMSVTYLAGWYRHHGKFPSDFPTWLRGWLRILHPKFPHQSLQRAERHVGLHVKCPFLTLMSVRRRRGAVTRGLRVSCSSVITPSFYSSFTYAFYSHNVSNERIKRRSLSDRLLRSPACFISETTILFDNMWY